MTESIKSGEENKEIALKVSGLTKQFSLEAGFFAKNKKTVYAVNDVSFEIPSGSTYGIVGESGCGKTTTARLIVQMYRLPRKSEIYFSGSCKILEPPHDGLRNSCIRAPLFVFVARKGRCPESR